MLSLHDADLLLRGAVDAGALRALTSALGFEPAIKLDRAARGHLGLTEGVQRAALARGRGALRALLVDLEPRAQMMDVAARLARRVAHAAPEQLWFVAALDATTPRLVLAAPSPGLTEPVVALDVDPRSPRPSDVETFAALAQARDELDLLAHLRWRETLGRDSLTRRFYRELAGSVDRLATTVSGRADERDRRTAALLCTSRLLFLAFLQSRGWLDGDSDFLRHHFSQRAGGRGAHHKLLAPLFFGTLNTPPKRRAPSARAFGRVPFLNGGLFAPTGLERRLTNLSFSDDAIAHLLDGVLARYRLSPRENTGHWSDAAVDPEMLGRAFESLMHADVRGARGAFYTPGALIAEVSRSALLAAVEPSGIEAEVLDAAIAGTSVLPSDAEMLDELQSCRVLDPACGSGAFLVHLMQTLAAIRGACGDPRPLAVRRREVLSRSIFGVDVDPTAVWLCQLRLWLAVVVEESVTDPMRLAPLPNLDRNVREGDALAGDAFDQVTITADAELARLRARYVRASGKRKHLLARQLDRRERARAIALAERERIQLTAARRELVIAARSPALFSARRGLLRAEVQELARVRAAARRARLAVRALREGAALPFGFATHFAEAASAGGFDLVVGNPPWVRPHAVSEEQRARLRERFVVVREAAWRPGAEGAAAGAGFSAQADLAAVFTERAVKLARRGAVIALVLPSKLWLALSGGGLRKLLSEQAPPLALTDLSAGTGGFDAVVYPSTLVARRLHADAAAARTVSLSAQRGTQRLEWQISRDSLAFDDSAGAPWLLVPREVRAAFDALMRRGTPLAASRFGRPLLGVKSGCNEAFLLPAEGDAVSALPTEMMRPVVRGETVGAFGVRDGPKSQLLWTHDDNGLPLARLPAVVLRHLTPWRGTLEARADARGPRWWSLFRVESARHDVPRVVWCDIGRAPRACVLPAGDPTVAINTCYVVRAPTENDAHALAAVLNSSVAASWLSVLAEPARGGYRRFLGWTCARLPLPWKWDEARDLLAPVGRSAARGKPPDAWTLTELVLRAYGLRHAEIAPMLSWHAL